MMYLKTPAPHSDQADHSGTFRQGKTAFRKGVKVLSLFFIDAVKHYRDYTQDDTKGPFAQVFEAEYQAVLAAILARDDLPSGYEDYLKGISPEQTHKGYFSIDKKTSRLTDPATDKEEQAKDADAYDLILKDKERLLSFDEPTRFIFSHSALREGWDNPNVFVLCMLKHANQNMSRRQEIGRGLRLAVDQQGNRLDQPFETVHELNRLTVIANESFQQFSQGLQKEFSEAASSARPAIFDACFFMGRKVNDGTNKITFDKAQATRLSAHLLTLGYTDDDFHITEAYLAAQSTDTRTAFTGDLAPYSTAIYHLIDKAVLWPELPFIGDVCDLTENPHTQNFEK